MAACTASSACCPNAPCCPLIQLCPLLCPQPGADAFFPVFLFIVIRSRLPRLASNVEYIKRFRMRSRLHGQFDYMLCNLVRWGGDRTVEARLLMQVLQFRVDN